MKKIICFSNDIKPKIGQIIAKIGEKQGFKMETFNFVMRIAGSAKGNVKANSKKEAKKMIEI